MITNFYWPELNNIIVANMPFQQYAATRDFPNETMTLVIEFFQEIG